MIESLSAAMWRCAVRAHPASTDRRLRAHVARPPLERRAIKATASAAATHLLPSTAGRTASRLDIARPGEPGDDPISMGCDAFDWAARALGRYGMPPEEIVAVLGADNPEVVRRYMELHRERLEERLLDRLRALADLERLLVQAMLTRVPG